MTPAVRLARRRRRLADVVHAAVETIDRSRLARAMPPEADRELARVAVAIHFLGKFIEGKGTATEATEIAQLAMSLGRASRTVLEAATQ